MSQLDKNLGETVIWTRQQLKEARIPDPEREALYLVSFAVGIRPMELHFKRDELLSENSRELLLDVIERRSTREPSQYIMGDQEFYGHTFKVSPAVLIPRPETELLVDEAVSLLKGRAMPLILDLCTGSGCIAVTLALELNDPFIVATDISSEALSTASENAAINECGEQIEFIKSDLFAALGRDDDNEGFDLIVSNPPYIPEKVFDELEPEVRVHEPRGALWGGSDGLDFYRRIAVEGPRYLAEAGMMMLEVGYGQAAEVAAMLKESGKLCDIMIKKDLSGIDRVVMARRF